MDKPLSRALKKVKKKEISEINKAMLDVAKGAQTLANVAAKAARGEKGGPEADRMSRTHAISNKKPMTASYNYGLEEAVPTRMTRRNVRSSEFRTNGKFDQEKYDAAKGRKLTKSGGGRPRKKGGPLATTKSSSVQKTDSSDLATTKVSSVQKTGSSSMTTTNKNSGVTKAEPEAKDQTINVKATEVGGDLAQSKVGSMSNSGKKEVDPSKNEVTRKKVGQKGYVRNPVVPPKKNKPEEKKKEGIKNFSAKKKLVLKKRKNVERAKEINKSVRPLVNKAVSKIPDAMRSTTSAFGDTSFSKRE